MTAQRTTRAALLARLREGPLSADDWPASAASRNSLKVRIHQLRKCGFGIAADPLPDQPRKTGRKAVAYRLIREPGQIEAAESRSNPGVAP